MNETKYCKRNKMLLAEWRCPKCSSYFSDIAMKEYHTAKGILKVCPDCGEVGEPYHNDPQLDKTTMQWFIESFSYPFTSNGGFIIFTAAFFVLFMNIALTSSSFEGLAIGFLFMGYLGAYMMKVIRNTAQGGDDLPNWPALSDWISDIAYPLFLIFSTILISFAALLYLVIMRGSERLMILALLFGIFYFPMSLIAVSIYNSVFAINPNTVIGGILRVPKQYFMACMLLLLVVTINSVVNIYLTFLIGRLLTFTLSGLTGFYFLLVEMRILGMIYRTNKFKFNWMNEEEY